MEITINVDVLLKHNLSLSEYVYLKALYEKQDKIFMQKLFSCIDNIHEDSLQDKGFIKILDNDIVLRSKTEELFKSGSLFLKFLSTFPIKTPSKRYLSPAGTEGKAVDVIEAKWNKAFKNKPHKEQRAIDVLEAELKWRRETNQMEYIHNIETWLNQADYEKFEYLLEEEVQRQESYKDFM